MRITCPEEGHKAARIRVQGVHPGAVLQLATYANPEGRGSLKTKEFKVLTLHGEQCTRSALVLE